MILSTLPLIAQFVFENACIIAEYIADNLRLNTWESYMKEAILMKKGKEYSYYSMKMFLSYQTIIPKLEK